jgi:uncharacterized membrane protein
MRIITLLPWADWLALFSFFGLWMGYAWFARIRGKRDKSLIATTNMYRQQWMLQTTARDPRMLDGLITQNLSQTPAFFSSTSIIIIGGLFALLGTTDKAAELVGEIPFAQPTPLLVFEFKILVLVGIFVYAFFRFSWSMRQYTFVALIIGAMPHPSRSPVERKSDFIMRNGQAIWSARLQRLSTTACVLTTSPSRPWLGFSRRWRWSWPRRSSF